MDEDTSQMSCFCLPPIFLYALHLVLEHRLFPPAPKQTDEEQPRVHGAHKLPSGKKARATPLCQGPCCIANKVILHLLKSAEKPVPSFSGNNTGW